jgi:hypothetical protein
MWLLLLVAVNVNNANDIPARASIEFESRESCITALHSMKSWCKFESFKVKGTCEVKQ